jgi:hypothetical protein
MEAKYRNRPSGDQTGFKAVSEKVSLEERFVSRSITQMSPIPEPVSIQ